MNAVTRAFHLGDILSITTGNLYSPTGMDGIYDILNFMAGEPIYTHQIQRVCDECRPALLAQHPDLAGVVEPRFGENPDHGDPLVRAAAWLAVTIARYGETRMVAALDRGDHTSIDPIDEWRTMKPGAPITVLGIPDETAI